jgi:hypothetical protein
MYSWTAAMADLSSFRRRTVPVLAVLAMLLAAAPARAERTLTIVSFDAALVLDRDGRLHVTETIQARFTGAWTGIYRTIPVEYRTPDGFFTYSLGLDVVSIQDGDGRSLRYETSRQRQYRKLKIWVPGARDAVRTVVIRYDVTHALRFADTYDELYWNVTGDEWEAPIEQASATITLPEGVENVRTNVFTGAYGSHAQNAEATVAGGTIQVRTLAPLGLRQGLTAAVAWNAGVVHRPTWLEKTIAFLGANVLLLLPLIVFALMYHRWSTRGRDPKRRPIVVRYEPPGAFTPGEVGTLVDDRADLRDVTATLVDLAVRGFVRIEEHDDEHLFGLLKSKDFLIVMRRPRATWTPLHTHERKVLEGIFDDGQDVDDAANEAALPRVKLSDLKNKFYKHLPGIREGLLARLVETGVYVKRPDKVIQNYFIGGILLGFALVWLGVVVSNRFGLSPLAGIIGGVLSGGIVAGFAFIMPVRTVSGTRTFEEVLGFQEFLDRVDKERFERVIKTPELFEKYLPYAMALNVDKHWAKAFEGICTTPPDWYRGSHVAAFSTGAFIGHLGGMAAATGSAMSSAPRSAGGSGFGGGGSSGGGFGGGGGGGF